MTETKTLNEITEQLWQFLHIAAEASGLPLLDEVDVKRRRNEPDWRCTAYVGGIGSTVSTADAVATVRAYAALQDATVDVCTPYPSTVQPSGRQLAVQTHVVLGGIPVRVIALLDGAEYAASLTPEIEPVHVLNPFAGLLLGDEVAS